MNETEFKDIFCKSVKEQGGHTLRLAASSVVGLPDIVCAMPGYAPILLETKFIHNFKKKRTIAYTKMQLHTLNTFNKTYKKNGYCLAFGLIGVEYCGNNWYGLFEPEIETLTVDHIPNCLLFGKNMLNIRALYRDKVPTIPTVYTIEDVYAT